MLFILFLGGVEEGNEILIFFFPLGEPNAVFFCYRSCSLGIKCN